MVEDVEDPADAFEKGTSSTVRMSANQDQHATESGEDPQIPELGSPGIPTDVLPIDMKKASDASVDASAETSDSQQQEAQVPDETSKVQSKEDIRRQASHDWEDDFEDVEDAAKGTASTASRKESEQAAVTTKVTFQNDFENAFQEETTDTEKVTVSESTLPPHVESQSLGASMPSSSQISPEDQDDAPEASQAKVASRPETEIEETNSMEVKGVEEVDSTEDSWLQATLGTKGQVLKLVPCLGIGQEKLMFDDVVAEWLTEMYRILSDNMGITDIQHPTMKVKPTSRCVSITSTKTIAITWYNYDYIYIINQTLKQTLYI